MRSRHVLDLLREYESRNITFIDPDGSWPIVWQRAAGCHVWDAQGKKYLDLTAAFGVAATGHANPRVIAAGAAQLKTLPHAMGDVHPHPLKAKLLRELSRITFERWTAGSRKLTRAKTICCNSGFEAVEAALKTALLATGKPGIIAFVGGYHGLGYGALNATHRDHFRSPFRTQLREFASFVPFPSREKGNSFDLRKLESIIQQKFKSEKIGAVLVEPIQVRGGINIPPPGFLPLLRQLCDRHGALLILDEIYTGFGRTGAWFACEHSKVVPDLICLGKALTGGFPLSACVGRADLMDKAWPPSQGEAIHTSTFLGHPVGCAMALAQIDEIRNRKLIAASARLGEKLLDTLGAELSDHSAQIRGQGLLVGVELNRSDGSPATAETLAAVKKMLQRGFILLPEGEHANVISFTPPLTISTSQLTATAKAFAETLRAAAAKRIKTKAPR